MSRSTLLVALIRGIFEEADRTVKILSGSPMSDESVGIIPIESRSPKDAIRVGRISGRIDGPTNPEKGCWDVERVLAVATGLKAGCVVLVTFGNADEATGLTRETESFPTGVIAVTVVGAVGGRKLGWEPS